MNENAVDGLPLDISFLDANPENWREMEDPDPDDDFEDDEDHPTPQDILSVLGFDPDDEKWEN